MYCSAVISIYLLSLSQMTVRMEMCGYKMEQHHPMAERRYATMGCGAQSVPASGVILMPVLCADNWAMILKVQKLLVSNVCHNVKIIVMMLYIRWKGY